MGEYYKNIIEKVLAKYGEDADVKSLVRCFKQEVDDEGDINTFYAKKCEDFLNGSHNDEKFLNYVRDRMHRYLQSEFITFILHSISVLGQEGYYTDGRNEGAAKIMRNLKKVCKANDIPLCDYFFKYEEEKRRKEWEAKEEA